MLLVFFLLLFLNAILNSPYCYCVLSIIYLCLILKVILQGFWKNYVIKSVSHGKLPCIYHRFRAFCRLVVCMQPRLSSWIAWEFLVLVWCRAYHTLMPKLVECVIQLNIKVRLEFSFGDYLFFPFWIIQWGYL